MVAVYAVLHVCAGGVGALAAVGVEMLAIKGLDFLFIFGGSWAFALYVAWGLCKAAGKPTPTRDDLDGDEPENKKG